MFDSLRQQASNDQPTPAEAPLGPEPTFAMAPEPPATGQSFLGMNPTQRLIIAVLLMVTVCALGTMCLMVTGRLGLP